MYGKDVLSDHKNLENTFLSPALQKSLDFVHDRDKTLATENITTFEVYGEKKKIDINWKGVEIE